MPWTPYSDGLKIDGSVHYDSGILKILIERLRGTKKNIPGKLCDQLLNILNTNIASFEVVKRLSKWCTWNSPKQEMIARKISYFLFGTYCKRLTKQASDKLTTTWKEDYQEFIKKVTHVDYKVAFTRFLGLMDKALTTENKVILAEDAEPGTYFCIECHDKVHWRNITLKGSQFYHWRRNPECPLCSDGDGGWDEEYYKERFRPNYQERWIETIDELRYFGNFEWLKGKEWALNPTRFYLEDLKKNRSTEKDAIYDAEVLLSELEGTAPPKPIRIKSDKAYIEKAKEAFNSKEYEKAIEYYTSAIQINPKSSFAYNGRGRSYRGKKDFDNALNDFNASLKIDPEYGQAINNLGVVFVNQKSLDKALDAFKKSLEFDPYSITRLFNLGQAFYLKDEYEEAIKTYLKILDIPSIDKNKVKDVYTCLSKAYRKMGDIKSARKYE
jgi:tetratricopeptide (TPR) repeat protein